MAPILQTLLDTLAGGETNANQLERDLGGESGVLMSKLAAAAANVDLGILATLAPAVQELVNIALDSTATSVGQLEYELGGINGVELTLAGALASAGAGSGSGNATVPSGTSPSDPQEFVDAAVAVAGPVGVWIGTDPSSPIGNYNTFPLKRLVYAPATKANAVNLLFNRCGLEEVLFPSLASITGGFFSLNANAFTELLLPALTTIGAGTEINAWTNSLLERVEAPLLATVDGNINIHTCPALTEVSFPSLGDFAGRISIYGNNISSLSLGAGMTDFGGILEVHSNSIVNLPFEDLITLSGSLNCGNGSILDPNFAALTTITGELNLSGSSNATTLGLPALVTCSGTLNLDGFGANDPLTDIGELFGIDGVDFSGGSLIATNMGLTDSGIGGAIVQLDFNLNLSSNAITAVGMADLEAIGDFENLQELRFAYNDLSAAGAAAFPALVELWGTLDLENTSLENTSFSAPLLELIGIGSGLCLDYNNHTSISLPSLTACNGGLYCGSASLDLPNLISIGGDGNIGSTGAGVTSVDFSSLVEIDGTLNLATSSTDAIFPVLDSVAGSLSLNAGAVETIDLSALTSVSGTVDLNDTPNLLNCDVNALVSVTGVFSLLRSSIQAVSFPELQTIGPDAFVNLSECYGLTSIEFASLLTLDGAIYMGGCVMDQTAMDAFFATLAANATSGSGLIDFTGFTGGSPELAPDFATVSAAITIVY